MTTQPIDLDASPRRRPTLWSRWPGWIGHATAAWSAAYSLLGLLWAFGGPGFPFGVERDANADASVLEHATPGPTGAVIAVLGILGAVLALVMSHRRFRRGFGELLVFAWCVAALVVLIPDGRLILAVIRAPMILIGRPLGLTEIGFVEYFDVFWSWPVINQALLTLGGVLWAAIAVAYRRHLDDACMQCGRSRTERLGWTAPQSAARWGRWAVAVAIAVPVGYAATRWAWALDIPLGTTRDSLVKEA